MCVRARIPLFACNPCSPRWSPSRPAAPPAHPSLLASPVGPQALQQAVREYASKFTQEALLDGVKHEGLKVCGVKYTTDEQY